MARAAAVIKAYRDDILLFARKEFGITPDPWQARVMVEYARGDVRASYHAMTACAGPGKSAVLAWVGLWSLLVLGGRDSHPKGIAISCSEANLRDGLQTELNRWLNVSPICSAFFRFTKSRIFSKDNPETHYLSFRTFAQSADANTQGRVLSGIHGEWVFMLCDESGDMAPQILKTAKQASMAEKFYRFITAGNPTSTTGLLYEASKSDDFHVTNITSDPDDPDRSSRIPIEDVERDIAEFGRDDPWVQAYRLGQFPMGGINSLLSESEVAEAFGRNPKKTDYEYASKRLGVDVARFGLDSSVLFPRQGLAGHHPVVMRGARSHELAARVGVAKQKWDYDYCFVDGTGGYGAGVVDSLIQSGETPQEINFAGKAADPRFYNRRAEMWFRMAEWVKRGGALPRNPTLKKELTAVTYSFKKGKFLLEPKDKIKDRLGFSPDMADALALTFAIPESPRPGGILDMTQQSRMRRLGPDGDWEPLAGTKYDPLWDMHSG